MVSTTTYPNLQVPEYISFFVPQPATADQESIAAFLERETGRLDTLIAKKRQLIEKLNEKRTALISRTVTRGLNPNAKLKPSGIEWLADIPAHWNAKRFGYLFRFYSGGTPSTAENSLWDGDIPWVSSKDMKSTVINDTQDHISEEAVRVSATCKLPSGTLLMVNRSGILRHSLPVAVTTREMAINQDIRGCVPLGSVNATFVAYLLQGNEGPLLTLWRQQGATVESLNFESVKLTRILLPPAPEQAAIVEFLDAETAKIDRLVEKVKAAIEKLLEYRTALITAAVTGKIDVRNAS
jgi:type I restriction enzyme S subunit